MAAGRWLSKEEERTWRGYRRMRALLDLQISRDLSQDSGLSDADYDVLSTLTEIPERTWRATELARRLLWSTSRLSHHLARMEDRGLVLRTDCADDRRGAAVSLTEKGWVGINEAALHHVTSVRRHLFDLLTPAETRVLGTISDKVIVHLSGDVEGLA